MTLVRSTGMAQTWSGKSFKDCRLVLRKRFIGSIHVSFFPMVERLATRLQPLRDESQCPLGARPRVVTQQTEELGVENGGTDEAEERKPDTDVARDGAEKSPYRSSATARMYFQYMPELGGRTRCGGDDAFPHLRSQMDQLRPVLMHILAALRLPGVDLTVRVDLVDLEDLPAKDFFEVLFA